MCIATVMSKHDEGQDVSSAAKSSSAKQEKEQEKQQLGQPPAIITEILDHDVMMGRGALMIRNGGNVKFRALVSTRKTDYLHAGRNRIKQKIAKEIVHEIEQRQGRFVRMVQSADERRSLGLSCKDKERIWVLASAEAVMEKVKQALRDKESPLEEEAAINVAPALVTPVSAAMERSNQLPLSGRAMLFVDAAAGPGTMTGSLPYLPMTADAVTHEQLVQSPSMQHQHLQQQMLLNQRPQPSSNLLALLLLRQREQQELQRWDHHLRLALWMQQRNISSPPSLSSFPPAFQQNGFVGSQCQYTPVSSVAVVEQKLASRKRESMFESSCMPTSPPAKRMR